MIVAMGIDWTTVLVVGIPSNVAALTGLVAVVLGNMNRRNTKTSNGKSLAEAVEKTHDLATANAEALGTIPEATQEA